MRNSHLSALFGLIVALGGAVILAGWLIGIEEFIHPASGAARVKPITALCFFIAGFQLMLTAYRANRKNFSVIIAGAALFQFVVMGSQLLAALDGTASGIELIINSPNSDPDFNTNFHPASLGTILILFGVATIGLLDVIGDKTLARRIVAKSTLALPVLVLIGYAVGLPAFYFDLPPVSVKMAIYSAVLSLIAGLSMFFSSPRFAPIVLQKDDSEMNK